MWRWFHGGWHRSAGRGQREGYKKEGVMGEREREGDLEEQEQAKERGL